MAHNWNKLIINSENELFDILTSLYGLRWLCRGQPAVYDSLYPSIDRTPTDALTRASKLVLERESIQIFRSTAKYFADEGEEGAKYDDIIALMVLQHYGVSTRLLDWSASPWVATYFATENLDEDGSLWCFDEPLYEIRGKKQWDKWSETKNSNGEFEARITAFTLAEPHDWFICAFYPRSFPRQTAQSGAFSMSARFNRDHAEMIENLLEDSSKHIIYIIPKKLKPNILQLLRYNYGIWRGSLYPDSAGAAESSKKIYPTKK